MISQDERLCLLQQVKADEDYRVAAQLYQVSTGRSIHPRYFYKFLRGERIVSGKKEGSHQPLKMWEAMVGAIKKREDDAQKMTAAARQMRELLAA